MCPLLKPSRLGELLCGITQSTWDGRLSPTLGNPEVKRRAGEILWWWDVRACCMWEMNALLVPCGTQCIWVSPTDRLLALKESSPVPFQVLGKRTTLKRWWDPQWWEGESWTGHRMAGQRRTMVYTVGSVSRRTHKDTPQKEGWPFFYLATENPIIR